MKKLAFLLVLLPFATACGGNDVTCGEVGTRCGEDAAYECEFDETQVAFDEAAPDGTVPEDILAFAEIDIEDTAASNVVTDAAAHVSMEVVRRGDHATYKESNGCGDFLEIPMTVTLHTEDSDTFDESFDVLARVSGDDVVISHSFDLDDLQGSFAPEPDGGGEIYRLALEITIKPDGSGHAMVLASVEEHHDDSVSSRTEQHWVWAW